MSVEVLEGLADELGELVRGLPECGSTELLRTSRALLVTSWWHYEFLAIATLVGIQAVEVAFRQVVFPGESLKTPFRNLIKRAEEGGALAPPLSDILDAGAQLRNRLSHPGGQAAYTLGLVEPMIRTSHLFVRDLYLRRRIGK